MVTELQGGIGSREGGSCVILLEWYLGQLVLDLIVVGKGWVDLAGGLVRGVEGWCIVIVDVRGLDGVDVGDVDLMIAGCYRG